MILLHTVTLTAAPRIPMLATIPETVKLDFPSAAHMNLTPIVHALPTIGTSPTATRLLLPREWPVKMQLSAKLFTLTLRTIPFRMMQINQLIHFKVVTLQPTHLVSGKVNNRRDQLFSRSENGIGTSIRV